MDAAQRFQRNGLHIEFFNAESTKAVETFSDRFSAQTRQQYPIRS